MSWRSDRGVALVEFALVAPVLFLVLFAIVDFGRALAYRQDIAHITAEGARLAAVQTNPGGAGQTLQQYLESQAGSSELREGSGSVPQPLDVCIELPNGNVRGERVTVKARFDFAWLPILGFAPTEVRTSSTMRIEKDLVTPAYAADCSW